MKHFNITRALVAGIAGTAVMTLIMMLAPKMGMPPMNVPAMLASFMGLPIILGWIMHFMVGTVLAVQYAAFAANRFPGAPWLRGLLFGLAPWLMAQVALNPMMGAGFFAANTAAPVGMVMGSLLGHMVYGAVVGSLYAIGEKTVVQPIRA
jgi:uncharacterized membrane protein YagU involved in acid resistance